MTTEIRVPTLGESVSEATVGQWMKKPGDSVAQDEPLVELETDKVTVEVPAPAAGTLQEIAVADGETVEPGALLGLIAEGEAKEKAPAEAKGEGKEAKAAPKAAAEPAAPAKEPPAKEEAMPASPAAKKMMADKGLEAGDVEGSGKRGQILKEDVLRVIEGGASESPGAPQPAAARAPSPPDDASREERVRMTRLRQTIARRLKEAQNTAAMLTTFNDVDMSAILEMRKSYRDLFEKRHGVRLGFMGFFVKASVEALKDIPAVNAEIDGEEIVYKNYYHVGVAVGTDKGLVVPVLRDADRMGLAEVEQTIGEFGRKAREGKLSIEEMQGGTFTISNGGIYGSMLSTPILNAPQSGILGMHRIEERPVVRGGEIVARPMMYLALSYDHRIVDGREAVTFLVRIKELLEDPQRLVLDL